MSAPAIPVAEFPRPLASADALSILAPINAVMKALASLKLTVALFVAGIFVVYVGTVAQQQADIWQVVREYFHAWVMWVDINLLFPKMFFPFVPHIPLPAFPAPGGMTVGAMMAVNLLAAHGWRFKMQATGLRLVLGLIVSLVGLLVGLAIVGAGHSAIGFQAKPPFSWDMFWTLFLSASTLLLLTGLVAYVALGLTSVVRKASVPWVEIVMLVVVGTALAAIAALLVWGFTADPRPSNEALRIVWQLVQGGLAGLVLLVGCILIFRKRGGMVLLHLGIGLLMFNELWVAWTARERQVFMQEGQTVNYLRDIRSVELALVDRAASKETDEHIVIPRSRLLANYIANLAKRPSKADVAAEAERLWKASGLDPKDFRPGDGKYQEFMDRALLSKVDPATIEAVYIDDEMLPVKLAVLQYYRNSDVRDVQPGEKTWATEGRGKQEVLVDLPIAKGTDSDAGVDMAGAYVRVADKSGKVLGTYMLSQLASEQKNPERFGEKVKVGETNYDLFLRFQREYKPYTLTLVDVRKDDYVASDTPRNYSSDVRLNDSEAGVDQTVHIKMNDPLRYRGDTLYQSGYHPLPSGEATTLQVVHNRGWMIPYVACMVVVIGMIAHFLITVTRFVSRREAEETAAGEVILAEVAEQPATRNKRKARKAAGGSSGWSIFAHIALPVLAANVMLVWMSYTVTPPRSPDKQMDLVRFGELPIAHEGRIKPLDTFARNTLYTLSLRETVRVEETVPDPRRPGETKQVYKRTMPAIEWLLEVIAGSEKADELKVIKIDDLEVQKVFGLPSKSPYRYSVAEIRGGMEKFLPQVEAAGKTPKEKRTLVQTHLLELHERLQTYMLLVESFGPPRGLPPIPSAEEMQADTTLADQYIRTFASSLRRSADDLRKAKAPRPIPVANAKSDAADDAWQLYPVAWGLAFVQQKFGGEAADPAMFAFDGMKAAFLEKKPADFNLQLAAYDKHLALTQPAMYQPAKVHLESYFNYVSPFYAGISFYVLAFLLAVFGWLLCYRPLNWAAFAVLLLTFLFHTVALGLRIYISGRPPVTNLYSSAIFIGWAVVLAALVLEMIFRLGLGNIAASVAGFATLLISYYLSTGGDTITVLQAVLDTQFWLATHVVCITLGYSATYLAGIFGLLYVIFGLTTPLLNERSRKDLGRMIYGITCFAILFSFYGTVLGGLWADDSWGRFWGWDPKENGALLIVLWNALVLHARWDKMVGDRGMAVLAIGGNIITSWSWFGVNLLGIGLHAYGGFKGTAEIALMTFVGVMLLVIAAGCLPKDFWWSFRAEQQQPGLKPAV